MFEAETPSRTGTLAVLLIAVLLIALSAATVPAQQAARADGFGPGDTLPDFTLETTTGKEIRLADYRGKVILLDIWASWCPDCREICPHIQKLYETYRPKGLAVLTVSVDKDAETVTAWMKEHGYTYPVAMGDKTTREILKVRAIPTVYLIGLDGKVVSRHVEYGEKGTAELERQVRELLAVDGDDRG